MDIQHQVFLTSALDGYQWSASHLYLTYMKRTLGIHLVKGWVGSRASLDIVKWENISCSCWSPVSTLTKLSWLNHNLFLGSYNHLSEHKFFDSTILTCSPLPHCEDLVYLYSYFIWSYECYPDPFTYLIKFPSMTVGLYEQSVCLFSEDITFEASFSYIVASFYTDVS